MADTLEWVRYQSQPEMWRLLDTRGRCLSSARVVFAVPGRCDVTFYPTYEDSTIIKLPAPEGMSIGQLKDWAMNQFLLLRES